MDGRLLIQASSMRVVIPLLIVVYCIALLWHYQEVKNGLLSGTDKCLLGVLLICYLAIYLNLTMFNRTSSGYAQLELRLFWSYEATFAGGTIRDRSLAQQILLNVLVYVPIGLLMPIAYYQRKHPYVLTIVAGIVLSILTEIVQYVSQRGLCEIDDVFNNTLGCLIGMLLFYIGAKVIDGLIHK